jgi:hypothetical protein
MCRHRWIRSRTRGCVVAVLEPTGAITSVPCSARSAVAGQVPLRAVAGVDQRLAWSHPGFVLSLVVEAWAQVGAIEPVGVVELLDAGPQRLLHGPHPT